MTQQNLSGGLRYRFRKFLQSAYPLIGAKGQVMGYQVQMKPRDYALTIELLNLADKPVISPAEQARLVAFVKRPGDIERRLAYGGWEDCPACAGSGHIADARHYNALVRLALAVKHYDSCRDIGDWRPVKTALSQLLEVGGGAI